MSAHDDLMAEHLKAAKERWDKAVEGARKLLNYDPDRDPLVAKLAKKYLQVSRGARYAVHGGLSNGVDYQELGPLARIGWDAVSTLETMCDLVGYQILDDGDPGVGYLYYGIDGYTPCGPDHMFEDPYASDDDAPEDVIEPYPDAQPYFHGCLEVLRETYPNAKALTFERALEVLDYHEKGHADYMAWVVEEEDEENLPNPEEALFYKLAQELTNP